MADTPEGWEERLVESRAEKDQFLTEHRQSPIPPADRDGFDGLSYFDPDPHYRVEARATAYDDPEPVEMETSDGRTVRYRRVVAFSFDLGGERSLRGYRREGTKDGIFIPFRDKTTGQQTYQGGRYMELELEEGRALSEMDRVTIDFNLAYFPFCAYSETFSCPLAPEENWLGIAIEAGERH